MSDPVYIDPSSVELVPLDASDSTDSAGLGGTLYRLMREAGAGYKATVADPMTSFLADRLTPGRAYDTAVAAEERPPGYQGTPRPGLANTAAEIAVPQTPIDAGILAGSFGAGPIARQATSKGVQALTRIAGAGLGGALGGETTGDPRMGAAHGVAAGLGGEVVSGLLGVPYRRAFQQGFDESAVGSAINQIAPTLGAPRTAAEMQETLVGRRGQNALSGVYQGVRDDVGAVLQGKPGFHAPTVDATTAPPPLSGDPTYGIADDLIPGRLGRGISLGQDFRLAADVTDGGMPPLSGRINYGGGQAGFPGGLSSNQISVAKGSALDQLVGKTTMTFEEAAANIELVRGNRHPLTSKLTGSAKGAEDAALKRQATAELGDAIAFHDPAIASVWLQAERDYGTGYELLRLFRENDVFDYAAGGIDMMRLQQLVQSKAKDLEGMLGPANYEVLKRVSLRGAPFGMDFERPVFGMERIGGNLPGALPTVSSGFHVKLPKHYVGDALSIPSLPFTSGIANTTPDTVPISLNPYRR